MNEYKGIKWRTSYELSIALGRNPSYVSGVRRRHPEISYEEIIDKNLGYEYRGFSWKTDAELSVKMGKDRSFIHRYLELHPNHTQKDAIDHVLGKEYKGIRWFNRHHLSQVLGVANSTIYNYLKNNPDKTEEDYIDHVLVKKPHHGSYRDITWIDWHDLSRKLGKCESYVGVWVKRNEGKPITDLIDSILGEVEHL